MTWKEEEVEGCLLKEMGVLEEMKDVGVGSYVDFVEKAATAGRVVLITASLVMTTVLVSVAEGRGVELNVLLTVLTCVLVEITVDMVVGADVLGGAVLLTGVFVGAVVDIDVLVADVSMD